MLAFCVDMCQPSNIVSETDWEGRNYFFFIQAESLLHIKANSNDLFNSLAVDKCL